MNFQSSQQPRKPEKPGNIKWLGKAWKLPGCIFSNRVFINSVKSIILCFDLFWCMIIVTNLDTYFYQTNIEKPLKFWYGRGVPQISFKSARVSTNESLWRSFWAHFAYQLFHLELPWGLTGGAPELSTTYEGPHIEGFPFDFCYFRNNETFSVFTKKFTDFNYIIKPLILSKKSPNLVENSPSWQHCMMPLHCAVGGTKEFQGIVLTYGRMLLRFFCSG